MYWNYKSGEFLVDSLFSIGTIFEKFGDGLGMLIMSKMLLPLLLGLKHSNCTNSIHRFITTMLCECTPREGEKIKRENMVETFSRIAGWNLELVNSKTQSKILDLISISIMSNYVIGHLISRRHCSIMQELHMVLPSDLVITMPVMILWTIRQLWKTSGKIKLIVRSKTELLDHTTYHWTSTITLTGQTSIVGYQQRMMKLLSAEILKQKLN